MARSPRIRVAVYTLGVKHCDALSLEAYREVTVEHFVNEHGATSVLQPILTGYKLQVQFAEGDRVVLLHDSIVLNRQQ